MQQSQCDHQEEDFEEADEDVGLGVDQKEDGKESAGHTPHSQVSNIMISNTNLEPSKYTYR